MTRQEHLLKILEEECAEVAHRVSKAMRFGLQEIEPNQILTNVERIVQEMDDLDATYDLCVQEGLLPPRPIINVRPKQEKIEKYLQYACKIGTLRQWE